MFNNSHSLISSWIAGALVCASLQVMSEAAQRPSPKAAATATEAGELFDGSELHDIWIHINARDWEQLRTAYRENTYYPADIEWRGVKVRNAGIRVRGRTSRNPHKPALAHRLQSLRCRPGVSRSQIAGARQSVAGPFDDPGASGHADLSTHGRTRSS